MFPFFNSQQQGMPQNSMQMQPNMNMMNPQIPNPFNAQNFANCPNNLMNFPNNHLGVPQIGPFGSVNLPIGNMGFPTPNNVNLLANMRPQQLNGNLGFPNGQFLVRNSMPMPMSGFNQNPGFFGNSQFGALQPNQQGMVMPGMGGNMMNPSGIVGQQGMVVPGMGGNMMNPSGMTGQCSQGNWVAPVVSGSVGPQQSQNLQSPIMNAQGNSVNSNGKNSCNSNWKQFPGRNFNRNTNGEASHEGFKKPQLHHAKNAKRKFGTFNENNQKGLGKVKAGKFDLANSTNPARERKRTLIYSEQEIQKWREERKRNYPSKSNVDKKLMDSKIIETEASVRREQLKEILAKQAELGVEVAEIPTHYLSKSDKKVDETKKDTRQFNKKGKFQNKFDKRGRRNKRGRFPNKQNFENKETNVSSMNKKKPSLLEKLLSSDIKRDKNNLLQVFRFMVMNSCFKDWPEKPLKYPEVIVREDGLEGENADGIKLTVPGDVSEANIKTIDHNTVEDGDNNAANDSSSSDDDDGVDAEGHIKEPSSASCRIGVRKNVETLKEEGEVI